MAKVAIKRRAAPLVMPEATLHAWVAMGLDQVLPDDALWFHVPNEGKRGWHAQRSFKRLGARAGVPDIIIMRGGKAWCIELKSAKGKLTAAQRAFHVLLERAGIPVKVCRDRAEVMMALSGWGLLQKRPPTVLGVPGPRYTFAEG